MIVGRPPADVFVKPPESVAAPVLQVDNVRVGRFGPVSFVVRAGEIVDLAGLRGAGQNAIGRPIAGIDRIGSGTITVGGRKLDARTNESDAIGLGIRFVTSNREEEGLAGSMTGSQVAPAHAIRCYSPQCAPRVMRAPDSRLALRLMKGVVV